MLANKTYLHIRKRKKAGQSLVETLAGFMLLIPLALVSYDLTFILLASQNNERLADNAARAAANHGDPITAQKSAQQAIDDFQQATKYGKVTLTNFTYNDQNSGEISLTLQMDINLPVVIATWHSMTVNALGVQPIVGVPADR